MRPASPSKTLARLWSGHHRAWRDPAQVIAPWREAGELAPKLLSARVTGPWWDLLEHSGITLLVSREYEHLLLALRGGAEKSRVSFFRLPHPSGIACDRKNGKVFIASSRNPNQVYEFQPVTESHRRLDTKRHSHTASPLLPLESRFYPGCLYLHDLAMIGGLLHGNAVGLNTVVRFEGDGSFKSVWWPRAAESGKKPLTERNHLQLNSIAAGNSLESSFFSASTDQIGRLKPGHPDFPVDRRGVLFSGATREPVARGLTRPHSARLHDNNLWVANSGYGEFGRIENRKFLPLQRFPGWTRGVCFSGKIAFVATSRVIPKFYRYAPGLDASKSVCGVHAVDIKSGKILASIRWPYGYQIFALDWLPASKTSGFPFRPGMDTDQDIIPLFYSFKRPGSYPCPA